MKNKWYQKATVQSALVGGLLGASGAILAAIIITSAKREAAPVVGNANQVVINIPSAEGLDPSRIAKALQPRAEQPKPSSVNSNSGIKLEGEQVSEAESILLLIDTSASMIKYPIADVVIEFVGRLNNQDLVGLITFDERAVDVLPFGRYPLDKFREILSTPTSRMGRFTDIGSGIEAAAEALQQVPTPNKRLVLVTDGLDNAKANLSEETWEFKALEGVRFEIILLGNVSTAEIKRRIPQAQKVWHYRGVFW